MTEARKLYRISDLARLSGLSTSTIKYYLAEGLIRPSRKTGKTMFWYEPEVVDQLLLIKRLQAERFLPLAVIKQLLSSHDLSDTQIQLTRAIYRVPQGGLEEREVSHNKIAQVSGYPLERIDELTRQGILKPRIRGGVAQYDQFDLKIIEIAKDREKRGLPFDYDLKVFGVYARSLESAVKEDIRLFITMVLAHVNTQQAISLISDVDELLNLFLLYTRQKLSRIYSELTLEELSDMGERLVSYWPFPAACKHLPPEPPEHVGALFGYYLAAGRFSDAADLAKHLPIPEENRNALRSLLFAKHGEPGPARTDDLPGGSTWFGTVARTVLKFIRIRDLPGFVEPARVLLEGVNELDQFRRDGSEQDLIRQTADFLAATVYLSLPAILGYGEKGRSLFVEALAGFERCLSERTETFPPWLCRTIAEEILPDLRKKLECAKG